MPKRILYLIKKHREKLKYLFFGILTTCVNYVAYVSLFYITKGAALSNMISWLIAVIFAYLTNKLFVFESHDWSMRAVLPELGKFVGYRLVSGVFETLVLYVIVDRLLLNGYIWKASTSIVVVILNYFFSKYMIFKKK